MIYRILIMLLLAVRGFSGGKPARQSLRSGTMQQRRQPLSLIPSIYTSMIRDPNEEEIHQLHSFLEHFKNVAIITGAGISTGSGIPDYRGPNGSYKKGHKPMVHDEFVRSDIRRKRYWARSILGWDSFNRAMPNDAHYALAQLQMMKGNRTIITQNVDRLHQKAGSTSVIDLHGRNDQVGCLSCGYSMSRRIVQNQLRDMNSLFIGTLKTSQKDAARADGDAEIDTSDLSSFVYPTCPRCGGVLKPEVVFFGDNVPRDRVEEVAAIVDSSDAMLVVGSSLEVYSAFRFVDRLCKRGAPLAVINAGPTRVERTDHSKNVLYRSESLCAPLLREAVSRLQN